MSTKLTHSYSAMKMYENCPLRYKMQRVDKVVKDVGGTAMVWGQDVHEALENNLRDGAPLTERYKSFQPLANAVVAGVPEGAELKVEQELTLNEQLTPTGWWDSDAWLRSKLDVLVLHGDMALDLDWKTGKRRPDFFQLELFALQTFIAYPQINTVNSMFVWTQTGDTDSEVYKRVNLPALTDTFLSKVRRIEKSMETDTWPAKPSGLCNWCPAKTMCDFAQ